MSEAPPRQQVNGSETIRMGASDGLPHYSDPNAPYEAPAGAPPGATPSAPPGTSYVALRPAPGQSDAYAILKAFQDYMELERQRAQRRTTLVACCFAAVLALVVAGFAAIWFSTMRDLQGTQASLINATLASQQPQVDVGAAIATAVEKATAGQSAAIASAIAAAEKSAAERAEAEKAAQKAAEEAARAALEKAAAERAEAEKAAQEKAAAERAALEKAAAEKEAKEAAERAARDAEVTAALAKMTAALEAVRKDNEALRRDNDALRRSAGASGSGSAGARPAAAKPAGALSPASATPVVNARVETIAPVPRIKRPAPPKGFAAESLTVPVGEKLDGQVNWRLFLPSDPQ